MHIYLKFERETFKIVIVMAVLIVFLNALASCAPTCMHVLSCNYDSSILYTTFKYIYISRLKEKY